MWLKYSFELIYMQIVETIKYTLSPPANDLQCFHTAVLWLLPRALCLQTADSHPARVGVSKEQGAGSEVHCSFQREGLEGNTSKGSCLSSAGQHNSWHSRAVNQINVLIRELTCLENNLGKKDEFSDLPHSVTPQAVALAQPRGPHAAVCFTFKGVMSLKVAPGFVCWRYWSKVDRSSCSATFVAHMGTTVQGSVG